ncbi:hypothetical protein QR680_011838 [Steinernema hermaphroditum]|uniref:E3 ubiquitin-protein ligase E3D n=1 Tax=Steinernema hermaphroditum TaxID=289476 RepID=A0AA39I2J8_9BILA|nr:hypothetical protein QR680_011838 [Steinernema hermaphroditum]
MSRSYMIETWGDRSFLVEMKPRCQTASVFVDCPPPNKGATEVTKTPVELLRLMPKAMEFISVGPEELDSDAELPDAHFRGIALQPRTVSAVAFADKQRLLICKVGAQVIGLRTLPKNFYQLEQDIANEFSADDLVEQAKDKSFRLQCFNCQHLIFSSEPGQFVLASIKTDDYLHTTPEMEYFCGHCCGGSNKCGGTHDLTEEDRKMVQSQWFPTKKRVVVSPTFFMVLKEAMQARGDKIDVDNGIITCHKCTQQIGRLDKRFKNICLFHTMATRLSVGSAKSPDAFLYFDRRFRFDDRFFAWMLLSQCEGQSSLKLVVRTYDKRPYLLLWLLESYVIMTKGVLEGSAKEKEGDPTSASEPECDKENVASGSKSKRRRRRKSKPQNSQSGAETEAEPVQVSPSGSEGEESEKKMSSPFPALKMLFKIFDESTALSDPRANGEDASVGLVDVPLSCVLRLVELLLERANSLPPTLRSVGQFYVGYLKLDDEFEPFDYELQN